MELNREQLRQIMPLAPCGVWVTFISAAMTEFAINTPLRQAAFLANVAHESDQLRVTQERLDYSAQELANTWPGRYANPDKTPNIIARTLAHRPEAIANHVYASRMGNGPEESGDGWRFRGAGPIQITGRAQHEAVAAAFGVAFDTVGDWIRTPTGGARAAARWFSLAGCNGYADRRDFDSVCDLINIGRKTLKVGDSNGYAKRLQFYTAACGVLGVTA